MPRGPRLDTPGALHHVIARGIERSDIFFGDTAMASIEDILELERIENDIYRGRTFPSRLPRTFGGQVAGQALVAAVRTVAPEFRVHSLHG